MLNGWLCWNCDLEDMRERTHQFAPVCFLFFMVLILTSLIQLQQIVFQSSSFHGWRLEQL
jgi:hypothetical protein